MSVCVCVCVLVLAARRCGRRYLFGSSLLPLFPRLAPPSVSLFLFLSLPPTLSLSLVIPLRPPLSPHTHAHLHPHQRPLAELIIIAVLLFIVFQYLHGFPKP